MTLPTPPDPPRLLTAVQVGELLGMSPQAVRKAAQRGQLPSVHLGRRLRFPAEAITKVIRKAIRDGVR